MPKCKYFLKIFKNRKKWFIKDLIFIVVESNQIFSKKNVINEFSEPETLSCNNDRESNEGIRNNSD